MSICEEQSINASALLRKWIENFIEDYENKRSMNQDK